MNRDYLAWTFHRILADMIVEACLKAGRETGIGTAALSGGVFQNTLLLGMCIKDLEEAGFRVLRHHMIAPNDGGIGLGQAAYGLEWLRRKQEEKNNPDHFLNHRSE